MKRLLFLILLVSVIYIAEKEDRVLLPNEISREETKGSFNSGSAILTVVPTSQVEKIEDEPEDTIQEVEAILTVVGVDEEPIVEDVSQVYFWLGTKSGAVKDTLKDGEMKVYHLGRKEYHVKVVFIGEGPNNEGEVMFQVNGKTLKTLARKDSDLFAPKEFIYVKEVFFRG